MGEKVVRPCRFAVEADRLILELELPQVGLGRQAKPGSEKVKKKINKRRKRSLTYIPHLISHCSQTILKFISIVFALDGSILFSHHPVSLFQIQNQLE